MADTDTQTKPSIHPRSQWFRSLGFGMFIHWGPYSALGHGEWALHDERIPLEEYDRIAARFDARCYDPRAWVALAKEAGMRYLVLTSRHHDGYCLFNSQTDPRNAVRGTPGRDLVGEFVRACREGGMGVGLYYSLVNWYQEQELFQAYSAYTGFNPSDNPAIDAVLKPIVDCVHAQVHELLSNYGPLDILWFDGGFPAKQEVSRAEELYQMIRSLQPNCLINNRGTLPGDFATPEQKVEVPEDERPWETCMTIADRWGYHAGDTNYKSTATLLRILRQIVTQGGNFLLNVGPYADGTIPWEQANRLREMGAWLRVHGQALFGCQRIPVGHAEWGGWATYDGQYLYLHLDRWTGSEFCCAGLQNRILSATLLTTGQPLTFSQLEPARAIFHSLPDQAPNAHGSVIALQVEGKPVFVPEIPIR